MPEATHINRLNVHLLDSENEVLTRAVERRKATDPRITKSDVVRELIRDNLDRPAPIAPGSRRRVKK